MCGMKHPFGGQVLQRLPLAERLRQADVRSPEQRRVARLVETEQALHLLVQCGVGEGVGGELVAQEVADDLLGVGDGVEHDGGS